MKLICAFFFLFGLISNSALSQDTVTVYFDKNWEETADKNLASYYRKAFLNSNDVWVVYDYYVNDTIQMIGTYSSKQLRTKQGHFIYYYENGQKKSEGDYHKNKSNGIWSYWYESGEKKSEGMYKNDKKEGLWNYWYKNGQLKCDEIFIDDLITSSSGYFENGDKSFKGNFMEGLRHGEWIFWNTDGRITLKGKYYLGDKNGEWIRYFQNSSMKIHYVYGILIGKNLGGIVRIE